MILRRATATDEGAILDLLARCGLPGAGVREHLAGFWVAEHQGAVVGTAGVEVYGQVALLRSVATDPAHRGQGVARRLCHAALSEAARQGARHAYLLTETAAAYFHRYFGFREVPRSQADPRLGASAEFQGACPESARLMVRSLPIEERGFSFGGCPRTVGGGG